MVQKKQPAQRVKKKPNAKSQEKLSCLGSIAAPAPQSASATNAITPSRMDRPVKRLLSKYSPSGVGTVCKRSLIVCPIGRDGPPEHPQSPHVDCAVRHAGRQ